MCLFRGTYTANINNKIFIVHLSYYIYQVAVPAAVSPPALRPNPPPPPGLR